MSEQLLSALLDGECTPAEAEAVLAAIERSPALKARWSRMCLTRDALAGVAIAKPSFDFAAGVMAAIASEVQAEAPIEVNPRVVPLRRPAVVAQPVPVMQPQRGARRRWQPITGLAAAASIAAVALVGGRALLNTPIDGGAVSSGASQVTASVNPNIVKVSADGEIIGAAGGAAGQDSRWAQLDNETARQLNDYLLEHSNSRADAGMGGSLGYARLAVRTADYRPADGSR